MLFYIYVKLYLCETIFKFDAAFAARWMNMGRVMNESRSRKKIRMYGA